MIIKKITALIVTAVLLTLSVFAAPDPHAYSWYCKNNDTHTQPVLPSEFSMINTNEAYYVNQNASEDDKVIYLTFDAGYENGNVERILDVLKAHNAKGAFFILGNLIDRNTDLVKRMKEEGNLVCNHTYSHKDMTRTKGAGVFSGELNKLADFYKEKTGYELDPFYRPPKGCFTEANLNFAKEMGYKTIFWSFAYADWDNDKQPDPDKAFQRIMDHTHNGMIILLHPTSKTNADIMDRLLTAWERDGYRFGSLYELERK